MGAFFKKLYLYVESIPDRFYPFASEIEGKLVRGRASYLKAVERAMEKYGHNNMGYSLIFYRGVFHVVGALLFISAAGLISRDLFGSEVALYVLLVAAAISLFIQEFYWHPLRFKQTRHKSYIDWFGWVIPMVAYVMFF